MAAAVRVAPAVEHLATDPALGVQLQWISTGVSSTENRAVTEVSPSDCHSVP
jgi:hypothetical protein